ncbi:MAG: PAS domain S-box protein, partial [Candidatus Lokiarchaeota archaeon]|nr:PAS domain S-box protein [Candidatus Lokiarchaeota archaeon]
MKSNKIETNNPEELFQFIINNIDELIGILNPQNNFCFELINNTIFEKILGFNEKDLIGKSFFDIIHPDYLIKTRKLFQQKKDIKKQLSEIILIDSSKNEKWFNLKIKHYKNKFEENRFIIYLKSIENERNLEKILGESKDSLKIITKKIPEIKFWKLFSPENLEDALYSSYEMLQKVIENIPQYIFWKDKELNYLGCNEHYAKLIGLEIPENIIGKKDKDLIFDENKLKLLENGEKVVIDTGEIQSNSMIKWRIGTKDSLLKINRIPLYDSEKSAVGILVTYEDITEMLSKEEKIRRERDILERFMETSPVGIIIINKNGVITFINSQAEKVFDIKKEECLLNNIDEIKFKFYDLEGNIIPREKQLFSLMQNSNVSIFDQKYLIKDYTDRDILISVNSSSLFSDSGDFNGLIATIEDITEKQKAKQDLIESENKFRTISEKSLMGIAIIQNNQIRYLNRRLEKVLGYDPEEIKKQKNINYPKIILSEDRESVLAKINKILKKEINEIHLQYRILNNLNKIRWVDNFSTKIIYQGKPAILSTIIDITEKK